MNEYGEDFSDFLWEGPIDSDEEIEELVPYKNEYEKKLGVKYSKNGIIKFIEENVKKEQPDGTENLEDAQLWEKQLEFQGIHLYLKNGGTVFSKD